MRVMAEPMLMTLAPGLKCLTAAWVARRRPRTLTLKCLWKWSSVISASAGEGVDA